MSSAISPITLSIAADPQLARLVRMTAANVAALSSMSVDRIEDIRMAAEEAFIYVSSISPGGSLTVTFEVDDEHVSLTFATELDGFPELDDGDPAAYADLILSAVCDAYQKTTSPAALTLNLKADV